MGTKVYVELLMSDVALELCRLYSINIPQICVEAVSSEISLRRDILNDLTDLSPVVKNRALEAALKNTNDELIAMRKEIQELKNQKFGQRLTNTVIRCFAK